MNQEELKVKVINAANDLVNEKGYIAPVDIFMKINILSKKDYDDWRMGRIPYLEKVCKVNLSKISLIMKELRSYALKSNLKSSFTVYKKWGKGNKIDLIFSKSRNKNIENAYSTHFINHKSLSEEKNSIELVENTEKINDVKITEKTEV